MQKLPQVPETPVACVHNEEREEFGPWKWKKERTNCSLVNSGERPLKSSPAHIQVVQQKIKDCMKFSKFCDSIDSCNNHRRQQLKTPVAHNFFFLMCQSLLNHMWPTFHGTSRMQETMSLRKKKKIQIRLPHIQLKYQFTFHFLITWQREQKFISLKIKWN